MGLGFRLGSGIGVRVGLRLGVELGLGLDLACGWRCHLVAGGGAPRRGTCGWAITWGDVGYGGG